MRLLKIITLLLALPLWSACLQAAGMDDLVRQLSAFTSYSATFEQKTLDQNQAVLQTLHGIIRLQRPDRFYWQSEEPYPQQLVSNGSLIWHYDADLEQVVVQEYAEQTERAPMLLVFRDAALLAQSFSLVKTGQKGDSQIFYLQSLDKEAALRQMEIGFSQGKLNQLRFVDNLQQTTDIRFSDIVLDQTIDVALFEFSIPEGADVLYE